MSRGTLVLLSGGIDSCGTLALYRRRACALHALFVDYGQHAAGEESRAAHKVAKHFGVALSVVSATGLGCFGPGYVRARNALLLHLALTATPFSAGQVAVGLHSGTPYVDCTPLFVAEMQRMFDLYCGGLMRVTAPFIDNDKRSVVAFCREIGAPLALTYSCECGTNPPCGTCLSCLDRAVLGV